MTWKRCQAGRGPIGLILLFLTGIGPLLAWRKSTVANMRQSFTAPVLAAIVVTGGMLALGIPFWSSGLCFGLCGMVLMTITQEFWRGARVRQKASGTDLFTALVGLFARSRRRYAGYIVHLGIVLAFLGFAGNGSQQEQQLSLKPGQQVQVGTYVATYKTLSVTQDDRKQMVTATMVVTQKGKADQAKFALDSSVRVLREYNDYFGTPYPLPKLVLANKKTLEMTFDDIKLENYQHHPFIKFAVAV